MFLPTMTDKEIEQEARKDFFELATKVKISLERFSKRYCDLVLNSNLYLNDTPYSFINQTVENLQWKTRRRNVWKSHFRFDHQRDGFLIFYFLYTAVYRETGTEYIFQNNLDRPFAERFTKHFIDRYKERHLAPRGIDVGNMPIPLYFQIHNPNNFIGQYYKTSDLDITGGKHKKFWIANEGIYVTDYIDGMLTYITFMDKEGLSPLKAQVYEEETVWHQIKLIIDEKCDETIRSRSVYQLAANPKAVAIMERFAKRNIADDGDGEKQKAVRYVREMMKKNFELMEEAREEGARREKEMLRKNRVVGTLSTEGLDKMVEIKSYHLPPNATDKNRDE